MSDHDRPTVLSRISTGTRVGLILAGAAALAMVMTGIDWRLCAAAWPLGGLLVLRSSMMRETPISPDPDAVPA
ncbi:hypothetical protein SAMN05421759_101479 [Roseivivax lentus]|uniref:Uncharacterized protein n=1 Tax=Roseivivax lentus TaxID=633194 RepID=A0A1N7K5R0_9RHOB|nr:hypothetical protein [Roseivivax lentus]SIS56933.1 hypothetical protein SAMN05421759_101479 [Roseivivax lentus]